MAKALPRIAEELIWVDPQKLFDMPSTSGDYTLYLEHWWIVDDRGYIAFYRRNSWGELESPQCNSNERIAKVILKKYRENYKGILKVKRFPVVFVARNFR